MSNYTLISRGYVVDVNFGDDPWYGPGTDMVYDNISQCNRCGSLVTNNDLHDAFHDEYTRVSQVTSLFNKIG